MKGGSVAGRLAGLFLSGVVLSATANDDEPIVRSASLKPALALKLATAAQAACRARDFQVSVVVVDRAGHPQAAVRDELAGFFTWDVALAKARTAAALRQSTLALAQAMPERPELASLQTIDGLLMLGGGVPVTWEGSTIGALGVSGAPTQESDHACAHDGLEAIADNLF